MRAFLLIKIKQSKRKQAMLDKININPKKKILIVYAVLAVAMLAVFWQVNQYDFFDLDDPVYVTQNSHVQSGITLDGLRWAFSTTYAEFWHPLTWLSLMLDYQLFGLNAGGYHLTNLILHIMSALLLFWLFNRMTGSIWRSAFVAALFALHPLHVESVAWIAERKDVLSAFFWMLTLCLYIYYTEKPVIKRYLLVLFSFVCGLMSKSMVVTLPLIMILLDYWPLNRLQFNGRKLSGAKIFKIIPSWQLREKIPFFVFSAVFSIITLYAQYKPSVKDFPLGSRIANATVSFVTYLEQIFWPHDLAVFYPFPDKLPVWQVWGAALLLIVISAVVIVMIKRLPYLFVGWLWYATTILPVIGIIQINIAAMADRYTYLPSIGVSIMLAWGIPLLFPRADMRKKILFPAGIATLAILAFLTWQQCGYWKNSFELFNHALQVTKDNYLAHDGRGIIYGKLGQYQRAIMDFNEAIRLKADYVKSYNNRGLAYAKLGRYQQAINDYDEAIRLKPDYTKAYNNRENAYKDLGRQEGEMKDFNKAGHLQSDNVNAYNEKGNAYYKYGRYQLAIENYSEAIRRQPHNILAYNNRGLAYLLQGEKILGCRDAQKACELGSCRVFELAKSRGYCR
jgi:tetratricopeptide (TPR) repeat protein